MIRILLIKTSNKVKIDKKRRAVEALRKICGIMQGFGDLAPL